MEKNCLLTKYKANTNDDSLLRIGEMRIKISSIESPNEYSQGIVLGFDKSVDLEIIGEGYFTDASLSANNGKKMTCNVGNNFIYFSNGNYEIAVLDKYSLNKIQTSTPEGRYYPNKVIDLKYLKYSSKLIDINARSGNVSGDISALSGLTSLRSLTLIDNPNISGDISALSGLTSLNYLFIDKNNISGDISALSGLTSLRSLTLSGIPNISGDISALSGLTSLTELSITDNPNISGDISSLSSLTLLTRVRLGMESGTVGTKLICSNISTLKSITGPRELILKGVNLHGDLSLLPANLTFLSNVLGVSNCSWDNNRPASSNIFAIEGNLAVDNIDGMLNDFSNCVAPENRPHAFLSVISVSGTRTSASDAAVSSLKSKGYTILVNNVAI